MTDLKIFGRCLSACFLPEISVTTATVAYSAKLFRVAETKLSQGRISSAATTVDLNAPWDQDDVQEEHQAALAAPGVRKVTQAVELRAMPSAQGWSPGPVLSFVWALRKSLPIWLTCGDGDFQVAWTIYPDYLRLLIADSAAGSNGTALNLWQALQSNPAELAEIIHADILTCSCRDLCERCLLLPHTPESYVRSGFLSHDHLRTFLEAPADAG